MADGVAAGDTVYIDGEGAFAVASVTSATALELTSVLPGNVAGAHYRICRGAIDTADVVYAGPDGGQNGKWVAIWDSTTFSNGA